MNDMKYDINLPNCLNIFGFFVSPGAEGALFPNIFLYLIGQYKLFEFY